MPAWGPTYKSRMASPMKMTTSEVYEIAHHEAAHCMMCIMKHCSVAEVAVYDPPQNEYLGVCLLRKPKYWRDSVWISLAGPIADSIRTGRPEHLFYSTCGSYDFDVAEKAICEWLLPKVPDDLKSLVGDDASAYLQLAMDDWRPQVKGQLKRKVTLYTKKLFQAHEFAMEILHSEAKQVRKFMLETPGFLETVDFIAIELAEKRSLATQDLIALLRQFADHWELKNAA